MKPYYEGWYMKQQQGDDVLALIPGRAQDEAFIQVITQEKAYYLPFPLASFHHVSSAGAASPHQVMRVGRSTFTPRGADLCIREPGINLEGSIRYRGLSPLRSDIMGPFGLIPMETKHTVFSMRHQVDGLVTLNGKPLRFNGAAGYMEGDRGHSFPRGYTWVQSVDLPGSASVMLAVAEIPLAVIRFTGCIAVVLLNGTEHRFATYRGVRIVQADQEAVEIVQRDLALRIQPLASRGHDLQAPDQGSMRRVIRESPAVPVRITFARGGETLLDCVSERASYEHVSR